MYRAGCREIYLGAESGSNRILELVGKGFRTSQVLRAVRLCKEVGLHVFVSFILGFPWETRETVRKTLQFAETLDAHDTIFFPAIPFPDSKLFDIYKCSHGGPLPPWETFCMKKPSQAHFPLFFEPEGMTRAELGRTLVRANLFFVQSRRHFGHWAADAASLIAQPREWLNTQRSREGFFIFGVRPLRRWLRGRVP